MRIGLTYDLKTQYVFRPGDPDDANAEFDHPDTVGRIEQALESLGHTVVRIGGARGLLERMDDLRVDLVFNIAEGYAGRNREAQVPVLLEMRGIPFVGSDGLTQALTLDKLMTKRILESQRIPTPAYFEWGRPETPLPPGMRLPLIVKPRFEGSSKGLTERSLVRDPQALRAQADWLVRTYRQPALVEQFIRGREYTVALVGNDPPEIFPVVQVQLEGRLELGDLFYTHARIASGAAYLCPARIEPALARALQEAARKTYEAVECRDFGRVDFRVDEEGRFYVLEINALPSLSEEDVFMVVARHEGISYEAMIGRILEAACERLEKGVGCGLHSSTT